MKFAFFQGCNIPIRIKQYARAIEAVLDIFGVQLAVIGDFNCCGYPMRNIDEKSYLLPSARNLALAEKAGLDIMVLCNCCFQSLKKTQQLLNTNQSLVDDLNSVLAREGLKYKGTAEIKHFLTILHDEIGVGAIRAKIRYQFSGLDSAVIHGCHLLRPSKITNFDDSFVPSITSSLMQLLGANSLGWLGSLECCGAPLAGVNDDLANRLLTEKTSSARAAGAEYIVPICAYCYLQFDTAQLHSLNNLPDQPGNQPLPVVLYPQLLGLCLGLQPAALGLSQNKTMSPEIIDSLLALLGPPMEEKKRRKKHKTPF